MHNDIQQTLHTVATGFVKPTETLKDAYKPIARGLANLCTLPIQATGIIGGSLGKAGGYLMAKALSKDADKVATMMAKGARYGSFAGAAVGTVALVATVGPFAAIPVAGIALTATTLAIYEGVEAYKLKKFEGHELQWTSNLDIMSEVASKTWSNSCIFLNSLFPKPTPPQESSIKGMTWNVANLKLDDWVTTRFGTNPKTTKETFAAIISNLKTKDPKVVINKISILETLRDEGIETKIKSELTKNHYKIPFLEGKIAKEKFEAEYAQNGELNKDFNNFIENFKSFIDSIDEEKIELNSLFENEGSSDEIINQFCVSIAHVIRLEKQDKVADILEKKALGFLLLQEQATKKSPEPGYVSLLREKVTNKTADSKDLLILQQHDKQLLNPEIAKLEENYESFENGESRILLRKDQFNDIQQITIPESKESQRLLTNYTIAKAEKDGQTYVFVSGHSTGFFYEYLEQSTEETGLAEMKALHALIDNAVPGKKTVIFGGDLNSSPDIYVNKKGLEQNRFQEMKDHGFRLLNPGDPTLNNTTGKRLDHFLIKTKPSSGMRTTATVTHMDDINDLKTSDHKPLQLEFRVSKLEKKT